MMSDRIQQYGQIIEFFGSKGKTAKVLPEIQTPPLDSRRLVASWIQSFGASMTFNSLKYLPKKSSDPKTRKTAQACFDIAQSAKMPLETLKYEPDHQQFLPAFTQELAVKMKNPSYLSTLSSKELARQLQATQDIVATVKEHLDKTTSIFLQEELPTIEHLIGIHAVDRKIKESCVRAACDAFGDIDADRPFQNVMSDFLERATDAKKVASLSKTAWAKLSRARVTIARAPSIAKRNSATKQGDLGFASAYQSFADQAFPDPEQLRKEQGRAKDQRRDEQNSALNESQHSSDGALDGSQIIDIQGGYFLKTRDGSRLTFHTDRADDSHAPPGLKFSVQTDVLRDAMEPRELAKLDTTLQKYSASYEVYHPHQMTAEVKENRITKIRSMSGRVRESR